MFLWLLKYSNLCILKVHQFMTNCIIYDLAEKSPPCWDSISIIFFNSSLHILFRKRKHGVWCRQLCRQIVVKIKTTSTSWRNWSVCFNYVYFNLLESRIAAKITDGVFSKFIAFFYKKVRSPPYCCTVLLDPGFLSLLPFISKVLILEKEQGNSLPPFPL